MHGGITVSSDANSGSKVCTGFPVPATGGSAVLSLEYADVSLCPTCGVATVATDGSLVVVQAGNQPWEKSAGGNIVGCYLAAE